MDAGRAALAAKRLEEAVKHLTDADKLNPQDVTVKQLLVQAQTALDEARGQIMEMLEELPNGSRVAILDTADRSDAVFEEDLPRTRQRARCRASAPAHRTA